MVLFYVQIYWPKFCFFITFCIHFTNHIKCKNRTEKDVSIVKICEKDGDEISEVMQLPIRRMKDDLHPRYGFEYTLLPKYYITATNIVK